MSENALVIGAGPAGFAAAIRLASWCETVTLVEARPRGRLRQAGEHLPPAGLRVVAEAGLESLLDDPRHARSPGVRSIWGASEAMDREYFFSLPGQGLNLDRAAFDTALADYASCRGVRLCYGTRLAGLVRTKNGHVATLSGPDGTSRLRAGNVVDASGRPAVAARRLGARRHRLDRLVGVTGMIEGVTESDDTGRLFIEAVKDGWWYGVQLANGRLIATFMTDPANLRAHPQLAHGLWRDRLAMNTLIWPLALRGSPSDRVDVFDASSQWLEPPTSTGFIAVGDAAGAYDPLSSWGIAKGIEDGVAAATALARVAAGEVGAITTHLRQQRQSFARHCAKRRDVYATEARWPDSAFWRARQAVDADATLSEGLDA